MKQKEGYLLRLFFNSGCEIKKDVVVPGKISKILPHKGLVVQLPRKKSGLVFLTDLSDNFSEKPLEGYNESQFVR